MNRCLYLTCNFNNPNFIECKSFEMNRPHIKLLSLMDERGELVCDNSPSLHLRPPLQLNISLFTRLTTLLNDKSLSSHFVGAKPNQLSNILCLFTDFRLFSTIPFLHLNLSMAALRLLTTFENCEIGGALNNLSFR
jgi:hypothetical protein